MNLAWPVANSKISGLETVFLMADERHGHISSTLIRELAIYQTLHDFIPPQNRRRSLSKTHKSYKIVIVLRNSMTKPAANKFSKKFKDGLEGLEKFASEVKFEDFSADRFYVD